MPHFPKAQPYGSDTSRQFPPQYEADRPTTARVLSSSDYDYGNHNPQYTFSQDGSLEEEEEDSEDDDVFAYVPPSTAEQALEQSMADQISHKSEPKTLYQSSHSNFPPPSAASGTIDLQRAVEQSPSTYPSHGPPTTAFSTLPAVDTPPSTDSQADHNDPYQLRRLPPATVPETPSHSEFGSPPTSARLSVSRSGARGVRVTLTPNKDDAEKSTDLEDGLGRQMSYDGKERPVSIVSGDISLSPSMMDYTSESREGSIK